LDRKQKALSAMNFKTTYLLFGVLLVLVGTLVLVQVLGTKSSDTTGYVLPSAQKDKVEAKDIDRVEIDRAAQKDKPAVKLVFVRDPVRGNQWQVEEPVKTRADNTTIDQLVGQVLRLSKEEQAADVTNDQKKFGLEPPQAVVTIHQKDPDRSWSVKLGDKSGGGSSSALVYVSSSDLPAEVMAARQYSIDNVFKDVYQLRSHDLLTEGVINFPDAVQSVTLQDPKGKRVILAKADGKWRFQEPAYGEAEEEGEPAAFGREETRPTGVRGLLQALQGLRVEYTPEPEKKPEPDKKKGSKKDADKKFEEEKRVNDFVADNVSDLAKYGLEKDKPATLRVEITRTKGGLSGGDSKEPVKDGLLIGKKDQKGDKYYARLESENNVVLLPAKNVDPILKLADKPEELRNRDLVQLDQPKVDAVNIDNASALIKLRQADEAGRWKVFDSAGKPMDAASPAVSTLLSALTAKRQIKEFVDANKKDADLGLDKPAATISVWVEGIQKEEKKADEKKDEDKDEKKDDKAEAKKDEKKEAKKEDKKEEKKDPNAEPKLKDASKPTVRLAFGKVENDVVYVRREQGGEAIRVTVPKAVLDKVKQDRLAYIQPQLPTLPFTEEAARVELVHGGQTFEVEKEKKDEKSAAVWRFKQPKDLAGRTADAKKVQDAIDEVGRLHATKLVAEKASDSALVQYGLHPPQVKVTVSVRPKDSKDTKTEDWVLLVGKETEDKFNVYAQLHSPRKEDQEKRDWVVVVSKSIQDALQADLQDTGVFSFDASKVKSLKLVGWQDVVGNPFTIDLEKKDGKWVVKTPSGFNPDATQVDNFVTTLSSLKAERFLTPRTGPKPEHKLDLKDGALKVEVTLEGDKEPSHKLTIGGPDPDGKAYYAESNKPAETVFLVPKDRFEKAKGRPAYFKRD
jgi:hypothetical protein